jgi:hypothetical protein
MDAFGDVSVVDDVMRFRFAGEEPLGELASLNRSEQPSVVTLSDRLNTDHNGQIDFLRRLSTAWRKRDERELRTLLVRDSAEVARLFDPNLTHILVSFIAVGGIDVLANILLDDRTALRLPASAVIDAHHVCIRVLHEIVIIGTSVAWYLFDAHKALMKRLVDLAHIQQLQEAVLTLLEHAIAIVGPAICVSSFSTFRMALADANDARLASFTRVLALLIVTSTMGELNAQHVKETFPQCLVRMQAVEDIIDDNVQFLLQIPNCVKRMFDLLAYRLSDDADSSSSTPQDDAMDPEPQSQWSLASFTDALQNGQQNSPPELYAILQQAAAAAQQIQQQQQSPPPDLDDALDDDGGGEEPPSDSADCTWFTGHVNAHDTWRLRNPIIRSVAGDTSSATKQLLRALEAESAKRPNPANAHRDRMTIVGAQSEVFFVLNSLLCTTYHREVWRAMEKADAITQLFHNFHVVFQQNARSRQHASVIPDDDDITDLASDCGEDAGHNHDPDTLRRIEYLRLLHEFWDAHDTDECVRFVRSANSARREDVMRLIAGQLAVSKDDVCVDNLMCYSLEAYIRGHWFTERPRAQTELCGILLGPLLTRLLFNGQASSTSAANNARRIESTFTLIAEICKYHPRNCEALEQLIVSRSCLRKLIKNILKYTFQSNFFTRSIILSVSPQLRCPKATQVSIGNLVQTRDALEASNAAIVDLETSHDYARRMFEQQTTVLARLHYVRRISADFIGDELPETVIAAMERSPAAVPQNARERRWLTDDHTCVPPASGTETVPPLDAEFVASAATRVPLLHAAFTENRVHIARNLMMTLHADEIESTEKLCVLTTSLILFLSELTTNGREGIAALLTAVVAFHRSQVKEAEETVRLQAVPRKPAQPAASVTVAGDLLDDFNIDAAESDDDVADKEDSAASRIMAVPDVAKNYYRLVCVWISHYVCQERYFFTLYFCTQIDLPHWRDIVHTLLEELPKHFIEDVKAP